MIRREIPGPIARWLLISQLDHAQLAGDLAEYWGAGAIRPLAPRETVLFAVRCHDEGWRPWEARPEVEAHSGKPYDFLEMPLAEALAIWSRSIDFAAVEGPLPAWLVSSHFSALLKLGLDNHSSDLHYVDSAIRWLTGQSQQRRNWLEALNQGQTGDQERAAQVSLAHLQLFDRLSLWFCCAERSEPARFLAPGGPEVEFEPQADGEVALRPWPLSVETLPLRVTGRCVEARRYRNAEDLATAPDRPETLTWTLVPG